MKNIWKKCCWLKCASCHLVYIENFVEDFWNGMICIVFSQLFLKTNVPLPMKPGSQHTMPIKTKTNRLLKLHFQIIGWVCSLFMYLIMFYLYALLSYVAMAADESRTRAHVNIWMWIWHATDLTIFLLHLSTWITSSSW